MWRDWSTHQRKESEFLSAAFERLSSDLGLRKKADQILLKAGEKEVFRDLFVCPQSPEIHAEGPFLEDHLRLMVQIFLAIIEEKLHLGDIEEFRRLKIFSGEIDEIEEVIKERAASIETFILCHDLGKPRAIHFTAREGSMGAQHGFCDSLSEVWQSKNHNRVSEIANYLHLFQEFSRENKSPSTMDQQSNFFASYQISISYPDFSYQIIKPDLRQIFDQVTVEKRLVPEEAEDVFQSILLHEKVIRAFSQGANIPTYNYLLRYAQKHGRDADDFLDLLLAVIFLEISASPKRGVKEIFYETPVLINFLTSEKEFVPGKNKERQKKRQDKKIKIERERFRRAGLDGDSLMKLLEMKSGPEFGRLLTKIQTYARGEGDFPEEALVVKKEMFERVKNFRAV